MPRPRYAQALFIALAIAPGVRAQSPLAPEAGLLLLTNGYELAGDVTRAGDIYIVTQGEASEQRIPADQVEAFCGSLDEAYEFKARHLPARGVTTHLELANWCLRHGLVERCSEQLTAATRLAPNDERLAELERRLQIAAEAAPPRMSATAPAAANSSADQLEAAAKGLPRGSVEKFNAIVQPILLNRCGATNQCHGPNSKAEFRLLRPPTGQQASRRVTLRNLAATLAQLDRAQPGASPLLTVPQQRHGPALTPVFDKHSQHHLAQLESWVALTTGGNPEAALAGSPSPAAAPPTIGPSAAALPPPAAAATNASDARSATAESVHAMRRPATPAATAGSTSAPAQFVPRDRYDAEIFNRQYHR